MRLHTGVQRGVHAYLQSQRLLVTGLYIYLFMNILFVDLDDYRIVPYTNMSRRTEDQSQKIYLCTDTF